ncbi:GntR family transcriptional regulator [Pseudoponticoccus marisrubri]|uniref:HTH gntR-type domain-containing protein n=1 Tax=Pseudoponticoccus marisrubri TaxID=1685382 RepID=A0A0W7WP18_9RHOB|nr:GntR family transcriptional regulator [Pseudoponticoccus marisrubri]KUF12310.1 hypothetical protein AVJ23_00815 [Pseudoponticoccus marisrubri]
MDSTIGLTAPRTTTDIVFDTLYHEILTLKLLPRTRISEAEVAKRLDVSRQPVRDAFNRLSNLGLLLVRPQRATEIRGFSMSEIDNARFVRMAVELEVVERACAIWDAAQARTLSEMIAQQEDAAADKETERFHALDYAFHRHICDSIGRPLAFETIERCKRGVDRLCMLSLEKAHEAGAILRDHRQIAEALEQRDVAAARAALKTHLTRLDETIAEIHATHGTYFE